MGTKRDMETPAELKAAAMEIVDTMFRDLAQSASGKPVDKVELAHELDISYDGDLTVERGVSFSVKVTYAKPRYRFASGVKITIRTPAGRFSLASTEPAALDHAMEWIAANTGKKKTQVVEMVKSKHTIYINEDVVRISAALGLGFDAFPEPVRDEVHAMVPDYRSAAITRIANVLRELGIVSDDKLMDHEDAVRTLIMVRSAKGLRTAEEFDSWALAYGELPHITADTKAYLVRTKVISAPVVTAEEDEEPA